MAGSAMTFAYDNLGSLRKVIVSWTSDDATGAVTGTTAKITGRLVKTITDPGTAAPTDDYDIAYTDEEGVNLLTACSATLADRDTANTEEVYHLLSDGTAPIAMHPAVSSPITIAITNAGNSKQGEITLYYEHFGQ